MLNLFYFNFKNTKAFPGAPKHPEGLLRKPLFLPYLHTPLEAAEGGPDQRITVGLAKG
jgi:hypothetical protein